MKELLSFAFALLFISCQNQPFRHLSTNAALQAVVTNSNQAVAPVDAAVCADLSEKSLDVTAELADSKLPGFYYRETPMRSEFDMDNGYKDLVCASQVTNSETLEESFVANAPSTKPEASGDSWEVLTQKWEFRPVALTCTDLNTQSKSLSCEEMIFVIETGKQFSAFAWN